MSFWQDKVVVVTGGSKGLGLAIATELTARGARVVIAARNQESLFQAAQQIETGAGISPICLEADVTDSDQAEHLIQQTLDKCGRLDFLFNVVGASLRCHLTDATPLVFREQMAVNFFTAVNCTQAALPALLKARGGLVNIASLAARTPWPLVGPYVTSKAALAAYTDQIRFEVSELSTVLLVCPGPIRRDDSGKRYRDQAGHLDAIAHQPGAGAKLKGLDPDILAKKIVSAAERGKRELILPWKAKLLFWASALSPALGDWLRRRFNSRNARD